MKTSLSLTQLAAEIERQVDAKRDFVADTRRVAMTQDAKALTFDMGAGPVSYPVTEHAHGQLAGRLQIPRQFYQRLAGEAESYDRASELERIGGQVIELPRGEWKQILQAAA